MDAVRELTTHMDDELLKLRQEFDKQTVLCSSFRNLARKYQPVRNEAVALAVVLKDFADNSREYFLPTIRDSLVDGKFDKAKRILGNMREPLAQVSEKMDGLKGAHNVIVDEAHSLTNEAATMVQKHKNNEEGAKAGVKAGAVVECGGAAGVLTAAGMAACVGTGPVGWIILGVGATAVGAGAAVAVGNMVSCSYEQAIAQSARKIHSLMMQVTAVLSEQSSALEKLCGDLEKMRHSGGILQGIVDNWGPQDTREFDRISKVINKKFDSLAANCGEFIGNDVVERKRFLRAMDM